MRASATDFDLACSFSNCMAGEKRRAEYATFTAVSGLSPGMKKNYPCVYDEKRAIAFWFRLLAQTNYAQEYQLLISKHLLSIYSLYN